MANEKALLKRIKRHVTGRIRDFFIATAPGLEALCLKELLDLPLDAREAAAVPGGVEFKGRVHDCYRANLNLRIANRILMRIHSFKASNFRQLEKRLSGFHWELFLYSGSLPQIRIMARHSRLYHKSAIGDRIKTSIANRLEQTDFLEIHDTLSSYNQQIYVRVDDDRFTISIDSSGEILHKRGRKKYIAKAPIRETIAAAILKLSGYTDTEPLVDPMCGSGTFSLEAAMTAKKIPAGWFRSFAFMGWPVFKPDQWEYIKREAGLSIIKADNPRIFASDVDENACNMLEKCTVHYGLSDIIKVSTADFFNLTPRELTGQTGLVVINPPYGRRIGTYMESDRLFSAVCDRLIQKYKGWKLALIAPTRHLAKIVPFKLTAHKLLHGGLKLTLLEGKII